MRHKLTSLLLTGILSATMLAALAQPVLAEDSVPPGEGFVANQVIPGLWATTVFFGDPADPATSLLQGHMLLHPDGTAEWDTTAASGLHPSFPFPRAAPTIYGTWSLIEAGLVRIETSNYTPGFDGNGALARQTFELDIVNKDTLDGLIVGATPIPCSGGLARCPNPVDVGPAEFGTGAPELPVLVERIPRP